MKDAILAPVSVGAVESPAQAVLYVCDVAHDLPAPAFDTTLARLYKRQGVETLPVHLEEVLGIAVTKMQRLDVGVFRVDRLKGTPVVARLFSARRAQLAAAGDLAVLEQLRAGG
jgi:hypothetical protein